MQKVVKDLIEKTLEKEIVLEKPKDISLGHYATPIAFSMAKELRKNPMIIAQELACKFDGIDTFESVTAVKGFVNFKLSNAFLEARVNEAISNESNFAKGEPKEEKILLEYVSANPTGPLHIGHARGAVFGDTLNRVGTHLGYDITTEYYINDAGAQMDMLGLSVSLAARDYLLNEEVDYPETYYRGEYLVQIAKEIQAKYGDEIFNDETRFREMADYAKDVVLEIIKDSLSDIGITFDNFVSEDSLYASWDETKAVLENNGSLYEKEGKVFLRSTQHGDDSDRVVVRDNGIPTYLAGDIIYHKDKYDREYDRYINIWGADHHGYIKRVKSAITFLGNDASHLEILLSQMVQLLKGGEPYKMSKRAGNVILMSDIANEIGSDALRFIFLTKKSDTHLEFDLDMLQNQDSSNPIFYINYAYARINQLFKKAQKSKTDVVSYQLDDSTDTLDLVYQSLLLPDVLEEAFAKRDMQKITDYLHAMSALVHRFYNEHKIVGSENENSYLKALCMVSIAIKTGLKLLGIEAKEVM